jgi:hypothetical protein
MIDFTRCISVGPLSWNFSAILLDSEQEGIYFMAISDSSTNEPRVTAIEKKPYEKPGFRYEQAFVTTALSCGKMVNGTQGSCMVSSKAS